MRKVIVLLALVSSLVILNKKSKGVIALKNKNPMNIRKTNQPWLGKVKSENAFEAFSDKKYSFRAAKKIIHSYSRRGLCTVSDIISTYAPATENNTTEYIKFVCRKMGVAANQKLAIHNPAIMCQLIKAMSKMESGNEYSDAEIMAGINLA